MAVLACGFRFPSTENGPPIAVTTCLMLGFKHRLGAATGWHPPLAGKRSLKKRVGRENRELHGACPS